MNKTKVLNILRLVLPWLLRVLLTLTALCGLCILGIALVLSLVFKGPSPAARDQLTMTLLESERTSAIPGYFLSEEVIASISSGAVSPAGTSDPSLIQPVPKDEVQTFTHALDGFDAQVKLFPDSTKVHLINHASDTIGLPTGDHVIMAADLWNGQRYAGFTENGILMISDSAQDIDGGARCGHVLVLDGLINESLFAGNSGFAPRAAIGQAADGTIIFITTDGWTREHLGATYQDMINLMTHYGAVNACLLDSKTEYRVHQFIAIDQQEG